MTTNTASMAQFRSQATIAIEDIRLQSTLEGATGRFRSHRSDALEAFPDADALRDHFKAIRSTTLAQLADHRETFERNALATGAQVHWARDAAEANRVVTEIAIRRGVELVAKTKSKVRATC